MIIVRPVAAMHAHPNFSCRHTRTSFLFPHVIVALASPAPFFARQRHVARDDGQAAGEGDVPPVAGLVRGRTEGGMEKDEGRGREEDSGSPGSAVGGEEGGARESDVSYGMHVHGYSEQGARGKGRVGKG